LLNQLFWQDRGGELWLNVKAVPGSSKTELAGVKEGRLRIKVAAAPEDGKANDCLVAFLAKLLGCRKKEIVIKSGEKSRLKTIILPAECREKAASLLSAESGTATS
jgi:uncharacterized protein (TIGR00251 family)